MSITQYDTQLNTDTNTSDWKILQNIKSNSKVLEFGPAYGRMTKYMKENLKCKVQIIENDPDAYKISKQYAEKGFHENINDFLWEKYCKKKLFDYIIFADVLEHLQDPILVLEKAVLLLKDDGCILISVPNIAHSAVIINLINNKFEYKNTGLLDKTHIKFFTYSSLMEMLDYCSLFPVIEDGTTCIPEYTEFKNNYNDINGNTDILENRKYANIYQFVFKCVKKKYYFENKENIELKKLCIESSGTCVVFYDTGNNFNADEKKIIPFYRNGNQFEVIISVSSDVKSIRFDPFEEYSCIIENIKIITDIGKINKIITNGVEINNIIIFDTIDPQIIINFNNRKISLVKIIGNIYRFNFNDIAMLSKFKRVFEQYNNLKSQNEIINNERNTLVNERDSLINEKNNLSHERSILVNERDSLINEKNNLSHERNILVNERDYLINEKNNLSNERNTLVNERNNLINMGNDLKYERDNLVNEKNYLLKENNKVTTERDNLFYERNNISSELNMMVNSRSWRLTRPLRNAANVIRKNKLLHLIAKGFLSLKKHGIRNTFKKIKNYKQKQILLLENINYLSDSEKITQKNTVFSKNVKISIVTPLYNTSEQNLIEMIESVNGQTYINWELCLADGSEKEHEYVKTICKNYARNDKRIKYCKLKNNEGIAENTVQAFNMSKGDYILLLDHDDLLAENALFEVVKAINNNQDADFIFSDRLVFDDKTKKILGYQYLPGFNPDLLRSFNYASHLNVFSRYIINETGFEKSGYNGSQDYEFELRVIENARKIVHIREILYYCRAGEGSVADNPRSKMYAYENGRKAIEEHIFRIGYPGKVEFIEKTFSYRIHYDIPENEKVSIIILNKDNIKLLSRCINSIINDSTYKNYEIVIIENNSKLQETFKYYNQITKTYKDRIFVKDYGKLEEFNFSLLNNWGVKHTNGKYLLFLNNDTQVITPNWIEEMIMFAQRDNVGAVGVKLYYPDNTIQHCGLIIGLGGHCASHYDHRASKDAFGYMHCLSMVRNYSAVTAACMMIKRQDFLDVGGFDEELFKIGLNDVDICLKLREKNKLVVFTPYAELYHYEGASRGIDHEDAALNMRYLKEANSFKDKWHKYFEDYDLYFYKNDC